MTRISLYDVPKYIRGNLLAERIQEANAEIYEVEFKDVLFDPYVQMKCQNCPSYGSNLRCPPYTPRYYEAQAVLEKYSHHYLVLIRENRTEWMNEIRAKHPTYGEKQILNITSRNWNSTSYWKQYRLMLEIKKYLYQSSVEAPIVLGAGGACKLCRTCCVHEHTSCKKPERAMASPESWGIDVYQSLSNLNIPIEIPPRNLYTRVGLVSSNTSISDNMLTSPSVIDRKKKNSGSFEERVETFIKEVETRMKGKVKRVLSMQDINPSKSLCNDCTTRDVFLCDRTFLPGFQIVDFVQSRFLVAIELESSRAIHRDASKIVDVAHRVGFYDALAFSVEKCSLCENCSSFGCKETNAQNPKRFGRKEAYRCIKYAGITSDQLLNSRHHEPKLLLFILFRKATATP